MHHRVKDLEKLVFRATDGEIGRCKDFLFDDRHWIVRYLVADTRKWLPGRKVLLPPRTVERPDPEERHIVVNLTRDQVRQSPSLEAEEPVSRKFEKKWSDYYRLPYYWVGPTGVGIAPQPVPLRDTVLPIAEDTPPKPAPDTTPEESHLRSADEVIGYRIGALDGDIGHVEDLIVEEDRWRIPYLVVDTRNWLPGRKVVLLPELVNRISWPEGKVQVDRSREEIKNAPSYEPGKRFTEEYAKALDQFYGIPPQVARRKSGR